MPELTVKFKKVTLVTGLGGRDTIYVELDDELQQEIHGPFADWNKGSSLKLEVVSEQNETALKALGIKKFELINAATGERHEVEWE